MNGCHLCQGGQYLGRMVYFVERVGYKVRAVGYVGRFYVGVNGDICGVV